MLRRASLWADSSRDHARIFLPPRKPYSVILRVPRVESRSFSSIPERTYLAYVIPVGLHFPRILTGRSPHLFIAGGVEPLRGSTCFFFSDGFQIFAFG